MTWEFVVLFLVAAYAAVTGAIVQAMVRVIQEEPPNLERIGSGWKARAMLAGVLVLLVLGWPFFLAAEVWKARNGEDS